MSNSDNPTPDILYKLLDKLIREMLEHGASDAGAKLTLKGGQTFTLSLRVGGNNV